ncbi:MAG: ATP-binding protein [Lachnospiraceae bacterium]|nr:ATP-binding protein [Lachnospiraceae bacterium]
MKIIGRKREQDILTQCINSNRPEFLVVYGRRRIGKTYLIKEYFNNRFSFYASGAPDENTAGQLKTFYKSLREFGSKDRKAPKDWYEAFSMLKELLNSKEVYREPINNRVVIFLDEMPWMDSPQSDFKSALDRFWNMWASSREEIVLIACGSATSWIIDNILNGKKGFHNRVTRQLRLMPFTLKECEELLVHNGLNLPRNQIIDLYMVFGGIPYYLNLMDTRLSIPQNIDERFFKEYGELHNEYYNLFHSLYRKPDKHLKIIHVLAEKDSGITRNEISESTGLSSGFALSKCLRELEECGFIRKYEKKAEKGKDTIYQLTDPFILFCIKTVQNGKIRSWSKYYGTSSYYQWRGKSFEIVCLNHISQIKSALEIGGVDTYEYSWQNTEAQIDLIIDRDDGVINLCEIKYTDKEYEPDQSDYNKLRNRMAVFQEHSNHKKAIHITLITANGLKQNKYFGIFQNVIQGDDLFS